MKVVNRKAYFDYEILEKFEAGIVLLGLEVKSAKMGRIKLDEAYVKNLNGEWWLVNAHIPPYQFADARNYDPNRSRKLLLHRQQVLSLIKKTEGRNLTVVPISCYNKGPKLKIGIAIARGKKQWEKREKIKRKDIDRETERMLRQK